MGSAVGQSISARGERKHDAEQAKVKRDAEAAEATTQREQEETMRRRQVAADLLVERKQRLIWWRERLQVARNMHEGWEQRGNDVPLRTLLVTPHDVILTREPPPTMTMTMTNDDPIRREPNDAVQVDV